MNKKFNFTKKSIDALLPIPKRQYFYDSKQKGLRLSLTKAGTKSYQFQAWHPEKGKPVTMTLGKVGDISISDARKMSAKYLVEVNKGTDPEALKAEKRGEKTLSEVFFDYIKTYAKQHKKESVWKADVANYNNHIEKNLGKKKSSTITQPMIKRWHSKVAESSGKVIANRSLALLKTVYNTHLPNLSNPCTGVKKFPEQTRDRFLKPEELRRFLEALAQEKQLYRDLFSLMLLTGARKTNVLSMRWQDLSDGVWSIPAIYSKNKSTMHIPLTQRAIEIIHSRANNNSPYVFPGSGASGHLADPKKAWRRILKNSDIEDLRIHDLRRTLGSYQAMAGANMAVIGASLGHQNLRSTEIYARLQTASVLESMQAATDRIFEGSGDEQ